MYNKIASITLNSGQKSNTANEIFIAQPDANKESLAGKLFVLIEIDSKKAEALKIINFLVNNINNNYYHNEKIILRERINTLKIEHIFETALAKTNLALSEFLSKEKIKINPNDLNITIGVIHENNLHFSNIGKNNAFIIYKRQTSDKMNVEKRLYSKNDKPAGNNEYKYNLADISSSKSKNSESSQKINLSKLFSNVISGKIPPGGYIFLANEALPEYLSNKQLIEIITKLPPAGAAEQIKNILAKINAYISFLGIIIKSSAGIGPEEITTIDKLKAYQPTGDSISSLNQTEEETEKLLAPPGIINFKKWYGYFINFISSKLPFSNVKKMSGRKTIILKEKIFFKKKQSLVSLKKITLILKNLIYYLAGLFIYIIKISTNKDSLIEFFGKIKLSLKSLKFKLKKLWTWLKELNVKNKILLITSAACLIVFLFNLSFTKITNKKNEEEQNIINLIKIIEQKQNQVDAHLLYSNEEGAKKILAEIEILLEKIRQTPEKTADEYALFLDKHNQQLEKIRHAVNIEPTVLADFTNLNSQADVLNIILANNKIYGGDEKQKTIYNLDLENKLISAIIDANNPINTLNFPTVDKDNNIYYLNNNSLLQLTTANNKISNLAVELPAGPEKIIASANFNNRLYLLDKNNNQIYRFNKDANGFSGRDGWIKETADLNDSVSLAIDGYVYILKSNGEILKYLKGKKENFELESVEPPITQAKKIIVSPKLEYIYILEPVGKRLIIFDKTGNFIMQYKNDNFTDLKDFEIDEANKKIYFLNENSVCETDGLHFEK